MGVFNWGKAIKESGEGVETALSGVSGIVDSVKGQNPELDILAAQLEGELNKAKINMNTKLTEIMAEAQKTTYDFALKYEGTAEQVPKWLLVFRSLIRPITTSLMVGSFVFFMISDVTKKTDWIKTLPSEYWWMLGIVLTFWFGGKIGENIADKINK